VEIRLEITVQLKKEAAKFASGETLDWMYSQRVVEPTPVGMDFDYLLKLVLIGESRVGKSSILLRFAVIVSTDSLSNILQDDIFKDQCTATICVDYRLKNVRFNRKKVKLQIVSEYYLFIL
jgi:GTPase SAR1 family protein